MKRISPRINDKVYDEIAKDAIKRGITESKIAKEIIEDFYTPKEINKYEFLEDGCVLRDYLSEEDAPKGKNYGEGFYCMKKAPSLIKLGSGTDKAANIICSKCIIREGAKEYEVKKKEGIKIQMPRCTKGGYPNEDLSNMYCPKIGRYRPVEKKKKKTDYIPCRLEGPNNANCQYLKRITIVKGLKEEDNR